MRPVILLLCVLLPALTRAQDDFFYGTFPPDFIWGSATSAYQIEGAWNINGKGESIWDFQAHSADSGIRDNATGDVASDSYHRYMDDIESLAQMGVHFYRFSLSWSRLLPTGYANVINQDGVDFYNNLIDGLLARNIQPLVTLYHWDLPQPLQDEFGGWIGDEIVEVFGDYANISYYLFGDRVKSWITFNEPHIQAESGYGSGGNAPRVVGSGVTDYIAGHNILKAHARAWHIYDDFYRASQQGECGITLDSGWIEPKTNETQDIDAAQRARQFKLGWFAHPIFSSAGDYPYEMKEAVARHSAEEGLSQSRLPEFDAAWISYIKGSFDFFGLNHYTTGLCEYSVGGDVPSFIHDQDNTQSSDPSWPESEAAPWIKVVPWGFRKLLNWIKDEYNNPRLIITENGFADFGELNDTGRVDYYRLYVDEVLKAVSLDGCNVYGYTAWSLIDNFEWLQGYSVKFGLYHVDFNDPNRPRTQKDSALFYAQLINDNGFPAPL